MTEPTDRIAKIEEAVGKLAKAVGALYDFSALYFKREADDESVRISDLCSAELEAIAAEFKQTGDADEKCQHEWKERG